ncbi:hypothetical protein HDU93_010084 [Gonapodya sp. JEL0774]|nr:hypothetical protein HDU93_010084 [Gonapodya sp. JEL0774]
MIILESSTDISTPSGSMRIHWFTPSMPGWKAGKGRFAGVVVYSEIYAVTEPIKRFCRLVCGQGYLVAAPEIYHEFIPAGTPLTYDDAGTEKGNALKIEKPLSSYDGDAKAVIDAIAAHPQCTGAIGVSGLVGSSTFVLVHVSEKVSPPVCLWHVSDLTVEPGICIGGHLAYRACFDHRVRCGALIEPTDIHSGTLGKGKNDDSLARMADIKTAELLLVFGHSDNHIPHEGRTAIRNALHKHKIPNTFLELHSVQHAFIRDELSKGRYDPAMAAASFGLVWELFSRKLRVEWEAERDERSASL